MTTIKADCDGNIPCLVLFLFFRTSKYSYGYWGKKTNEINTIWTDMTVLLILFLVSTASTIFQAGHIHSRVAPRTARTKVDLPFGVLHFYSEC